MASRAHQIYVYAFTKNYSLRFKKKKQENKRFQLLIQVLIFIKSVSFLNYQILILVSATCMSVILGNQIKQLLLTLNYCIYLIYKYNICNNLNKMGSLFTNKNVDIKVSARCVSGINFIRYAKNRKIGKPNNLKFREQ